MEKSKARKYRKWFVGLLILFFMSGSLFAQSYYEKIRNLRFFQKDEYIFSLTNTEFYLDIENISPNDVTVYLNSIPDNVELVSIKKETYIPPIENTSSSYGTHIVVTVKFLKSGDIKLFAADLQVKGGFYKIPFDNVHVYDNLQILKPKVSVELNNIDVQDKKNISVPSGKHIQYTVYVQFASEVKNVSWDIPENALFEQQAEFEFTKISDQKMELFSEPRPVAVFDWCPLAEGKRKIPPINVVATTFSSSVYTPDFPEIYVNVTKPVTNQEAEKNKINKYFADAFATDKDIENKENIDAISDEHLKDYCNLIKHEINRDLYFSRDKNDRLEFERINELPSVKPLPNKAFLLFLFFIIFVDLVLLIYFLIKRKYSLAIASLVASICLSSGSIFYATKLNCKYALVVSGKMISIPEKEVTKGVSLKKGTLLTVKKETDEWLYVEYNDANGWILKENVIFVE